MHFGHNRRYSPDATGARSSPLGPDADGTVKGYRPRFHGDSPTGTGRATPPPDAGPDDPAGVTNGVLRTRSASASPPR